MNSLQKVQICFILSLFLVVFIFIPKPAKAEISSEKYPRIANYYLTWLISDAEARQLAKWDMVILSSNAAKFSPNALRIMKQENPDIILLAYVSTSDIPTHSPTFESSNIWRKFYEEVDRNDWWLRDGNGNHVVFWPGNWMVNVSNLTKKNYKGQNWPEFYAEEIDNQILRDARWDGIFFDYTFVYMQWINPNIDINNDGRIDTTNYVNQHWQEGMIKLFEGVRQKAGSKKIFIANGTEFYKNYLNGRMYEEFPTPYDTWTRVANVYFNKQDGIGENYSIVNSKGDSSNDYQMFRFGLTTSLMSDGFYSFDAGAQTHRELWWFDEYDYFLGKPVSGVKNAETNQETTSFGSGLYQREFQNGVVLVNSSSQPKQANFNYILEKIRGTQDQAVNDGRLVNSITIQPNDGIILLRKIDELTETTYYNGSFVRIFNEKGNTVRNGFFVYNRSYKGSTQIQKKDLDFDGQPEYIVADKSYIDIYNGNGTLRKRFYPYGTNYNKGINFAIDDLDYNNTLEIITGTENGGGPHIRVFNSKGDLINPGFFAYGKGYRGGVNLAVCDLNNDGYKEVVTGAGYMGGPHIRIFTPEGRLLSGGFFAYDKSFRGGVNIACGDINGDGNDEIVTGAGLGGSSHIRIFDGKGQLLSTGFWAFDKDLRNGARVFVSDLDGDGKEEILASQPNTFTSVFR